MASLTDSKLNFDSLFHITDWTATLLGMAGEDVSTYGLDGKDQWEGIKDADSCSSAT